MSEKYYFKNVGEIINLETSWGLRREQSYNIKF